MRKNKVKNKEVNRRILILCEDEKSSLLYFKGFKKDEELKRYLSAVLVEVIHPHDYSPKGLLSSAKEKIKKAKKEDNAYDEVWLVFDKDGHKNIPEVFNEAKESKIKIAFSNSCFEYWVLLHFEYTTRTFDKCDSIIKYIRDKNHITDYDKSNEIFSLLRNRIEKAIINNDKLLNNIKNDLENGIKVYDINPYTNIVDLVKSITKGIKL